MIAAAVEVAVVAALPLLIAQPPSAAAVTRRMSASRSPAWKHEPSWRPSRCTAPSTVRRDRLSLPGPLSTPLRAGSGLAVDPSFPIRERVRGASERWSWCS